MASSLKTHTSEEKSRSNARKTSSTLSGIKKNNKGKKQLRNLIKISMRNLEQKELQKALEESRKTFYVPEKWSVKYIEGDGSCGYHSIALKLNYKNEHFRNNKYLHLSKGRYNTNKRKGFSFRLKCAEIAKNIIKSLKEGKTNIYEYSIEKLIERIQLSRVNNLDSLIKYIEELNKKFLTFSLENTNSKTCRLEGQLDENEMKFISIFYRKYIFVYDQQEYAQGWRRIGYSYGISNQYNSIFLLFNGGHYDLLVPSSNTRFKENFEDFAPNNKELPDIKEYNFFK